MRSLSSLIEKSLGRGYRVVFMEFQGMKDLNSWIYKFEARNGNENRSGLVVIEFCEKPYIINLRIE